MGAKTVAVCVLVGVLGGGKTVVDVPVGDVGGATVVSVGVGVVSVGVGVVGGADVVGGRTVVVAVTVTV